MVSSVFENFRNVNEIKKIVSTVKNSPRANINRLKIAIVCICSRRVSLLSAKTVSRFEEFFQILHFF